MIANRKLAGIAFIGGAALALLLAEPWASKAKPDVWPWPAYMPEFDTSALNNHDEETATPEIPWPEALAL